MHDENEGDYHETYIVTSLIEDIEFLVICSLAVADFVKRLESGDEDRIARL